MKWSGPPLVAGVFLERLHRFGAIVRVKGRKEYCHVPNSGRLRELLYPGARVALVDHFAQFRIKNSKLKISRKTRYAIRLAFYKKKWVCIEANIAPHLLSEAWRKGRILDLASYDEWRTEVPLNAHTRFDFKAGNSKTEKIAWIEVKCVTLVDERGIGRFPDAPSERASKHLRELMELAGQPRTKCFVFFILQNPHGRAVSPKEDTDPVFAETLRKAAKAHVVLRAFHAKVDLKIASLDREVPVLL